MNWKSYLKMILAALIPIAYTAFKLHNPSFPLGEEQWSTTVLWIIGALIGGWEGQKLSASAKWRK